MVLVIVRCHAFCPFPANQASIPTYFALFIKHYVKLVIEKCTKVLPVPDLLPCCDGGCAVNLEAIYNPFGCFEFLEVFTKETPVPCCRVNKDGSFVFALKDMVYLGSQVLFHRWGRGIFCS